MAQSTYGARPGTEIGDLGVLHEMEGAAAAVPSTVVRGAYYMSNWDALLPVAREDGELPSFFPPDFVLPMVAPRDLGRAAADLMTAPPEDGGTHHVEGPGRYSPADVAVAFGEAVGRDVEVVEIPPPERVGALRAMGFSDRSAASFAGMIGAALVAPFPAPETVTRGSTTLREHVEELARRA